MNAIATPRFLQVEWRSLLHGEMMDAVQFEEAVDVQYHVMWTLNVDLSVKQNIHSLECRNISFPSKPLNDCEAIFSSVPATNPLDNIYPQTECP